MTQSTLLPDMKGKRVSVLGIGLSNGPLVALLARSGAQVTAHDRKTRAQLGDAAGQFERLGVRLELGDSYLDNIDAELVFRTPGILAGIEAMQPMIVMARDTGDALSLCACDPTQKLETFALRAQGWTSVEHVDPGVRSAQAMDGVCADITCDASRGRGYALRLTK